VASIPIPTGAACQVAVTAMALDMVGGPIAAANMVAETMTNRNTGVPLVWFLARVVHAGNIPATPAAASIISDPG
jgi:hypothetical protein